MCALYGSARDISFLRGINKELINNVIQIEVDFYKIILDDTKANVYGEASSKKRYYTPVRLACIIQRDDIVNNSDEFGVDTDQTLTFAFLRDGILDQLNLVPETGDVIEWDAKYWEVGGININQYILGRNDMTNKTIGPNFGANWSYACKTNLTRRDKLQLEKIRFGGKV